ncbi:MAG: saccharopine dehydrogenase C-terminal domain-containing protein [Candidatus Promineifilaceae bacterium]|nr:saccharopine dehydrogenase C-terminal domain-containing protein [Candidatus Promineifilaceae bacterium]
MKVLLIGIGRQGKAALYDLVHSQDVAEIVAADIDFTGLLAYVGSQPYAGRVHCEQVDSNSAESLDHLLSQGFDVVVDLGNPLLRDNVAAAAVRNKIHLVHSAYTTSEQQRLSSEAEANGLTILPEFGLDPGIDLVLLGKAVRSFDQVTEIISYGAGFPAPAARNNPLNYKLTWLIEGLFRSYYRPGRIIRNGKIVDIKETEIFSQEHIHEIELENLGRLEAYPNSDALVYAELLNIDPATLRNLGRYVLRWPGHSAFWKTLVDLHFLDTEPLLVDGQEVDRRHYLAALLEPQLQYRDDESDVVVVRIEVKGEIDGEIKHALYQVIDYRDFETGFTAMNRTVGYTASIGAQMIGTGQISKRGLLSPVTDVPYENFVQELARREIRVTSEISI